MITKKPSWRRMSLGVGAAIVAHSHQHPLLLHQPLLIHRRRRDEFELDARPEVCNANRGSGR
jgi:hypothetical protein